MRVLVDSEIYRLQSTGGISRIFTESLQRLGKILPEIAIRLTHVENHFRSRLPQAPWIQPPLSFRPRRFEAAINASLERRWKPQIFHGTYFTTPGVRGVRTVATVYDFIHEECASLEGFHASVVARKRLALQSADCIIAISDATRESVFRHIRGAESKVRVIYPGVAEAFLADAGGGGDAGRELRAAIGNARPYWLFVGVRRAYKNFGTLLRAFARAASRAEADLVLIGGDHELAGWEVDFLISRRLEKRVHLLGQVTDRLLIAAYREAAAFVFPSCAEGFGIPLIEAMACGTRVLAADIPVFREIALGRAEFFDPHDQDALEELLLMSLERAPEPERLDEARQYAARFTWDEAARKLAEVYQSCAAT